MASRSDAAPSARSEESANGQGAPRRRMRRRPHVAGQTIESYLRANSAPRYMRRLRDIELEYRNQCRRLAAAYTELREELGDDHSSFARRWREQARRWRFDRLNDLIREHNEWYPMESNLPMDPRTGDYRPIRGASYRRTELGPDFVLEHFEPTPGGPWPSPPRLAPRDPAPVAPARMRRRTPA
jgi:hypothetical protein